jgi:hypothetical protein
MLAADGLWFADLLGFAPPDGEKRQAIVARLLDVGVALVVGGVVLMSASRDALI